MACCGRAWRSGAVPDCIPALAVCGRERCADGTRERALHCRGGVFRICGGGAGVADLVVDRGAPVRGVRDVRSNGLARIGEMVVIRMGTASGLGFCDSLRRSRTRHWTTVLLACVSQFRLGCRRLHSYSLSRIQRPNAESWTMIVCERSGPVETRPICTPICSDKKST